MDTIKKPPPDWNPKGGWCCFAIPLAARQRAHAGLRPWRTQNQRSTIGKGWCERCQHHSCQQQHPKRYKFYSTHKEQPFCFKEACLLRSIIFQMVPEFHVFP